MRKMTFTVSIYMILFMVLGSKANPLEFQKDWFLPRNVGFECNAWLYDDLIVPRPGVGIYSDFHILGSWENRIEITPRIAGIFIQDIQSKYLFGAAIKYEYIAACGFETNFSIGANYVLTRLDFDRYEYDNGIFVNKGRYLSGFAPSAGMALGWRFLKKESSSIGPYFGFSFTRLNKPYRPAFFSGYKPSVSIGISLYRNKL